MPAVLSQTTRSFQRAARKRAPLPAAAARRDSRRFDELWSNALASTSLAALVGMVLSLVASR